MSAKTYTTRQAAKQIGISRQTLQAWIAGRKIAAPEPTSVGGASVRFWTPADIKRAKQFKGKARKHA